MKAAIAFCTPLPKVAGPKGLRYEPVTVEFHRARRGLTMPTGFSFIEVQADGMEVGVARNRAVELVMGMDPRPEFLFFLDYDVLPSYDAVTKLFYRARCYPGHDIFCGIYTAKGHPAEPLIYAERGQGCYWDWTIGDIITDKITGCHMGLTLIRTSLFERMGWDDPDNPLFKTTDEEVVKKDGGLCRKSGTEDLYFCQRVRDEIGGHIFVDTSVLAGHINNQTGQIFGLAPDSPPVLRAKWLRFGKPEDEDNKLRHKLIRRQCPSRHKCGRVQSWYIEDENSKKPLYLHNDGTLFSGPPGTDRGGLFTLNEADRALAAWEKNNQTPQTKLALDIGAGRSRRKWDGYKTYTTDIRADAEPDYVMDTRLLNLPDASYDLVASSHHLEHFGRYEQTKLWEEMFRILKPGGRMEHVLPNLRWAGWKLANGEDDDMIAILDVLYGSQEDSGMPRECNTHYSGYTPELAVALAESVGLVDVKTRTYRDDPELGFNLILTANKPGGEKQEHVDYLAANGIEKGGIIESDKFESCYREPMTIPPANKPGGEEAEPEKEDTAHD